jgi:hypothetical protein
MSWESDRAQRKRSSGVRQGRNNAQAGRDALANLVL